MVLVFFQRTFSCIMIGCSSLQLIFTDGAGGKGTWGKLLDTDGESHLDRNDPNYDSGEVIAVLNFCVSIRYIVLCTGYDPTKPFCALDMTFCNINVDVVFSHILAFNRNHINLLDQLSQIP